jgi:uncharacterized protein YndB with AHSA1/START domain
MSKELKYVHILQEHVINAPRAKVYKAITEEIGSWWSHRFEEGGKVTLDARLGGEFREDYPNGGGCRFATVRWFKPGEGIELEGPMGWDGPVTGCFSYTLEEKGKATLVKLEHKFFGPLTGETEGMYVEGWKHLLGTDLKAWVEEGKKAEFSHD